MQGPTKIWTDQHTLAFSISSLYLVSISFFCLTTSFWTSSALTSLKHRCNMGQCLCFNETQVQHYSMFIFQWKQMTGSSFNIYFSYVVLVQHYHHQLWKCQQHGSKPWGDRSMEHKLSTTVLMNATGECWTQMLLWQGELMPVCLLAYDDR